MFSPLFKRAGCGATIMCNGSCCRSDLCCGTCCDSTGSFCCGKSSCCSSGQTCCGETTCCDSGQFCCGDGLCCSSDESCALYQDLSNETRSVCTTGTGSPNATVTLNFDSQSVSLPSNPFSASNDETSGTGTSTVSSTRLTSYWTTTLPSILKTTPTAAASSSTSALTTSAAPTSSAPAAPSQAQTQPTNDLSRGVLAGIIVGALSALLLVTATYILLRRRHLRKQLPPSPSEKPVGGRHELSAESSDPAKHLPEAEAVGAMVNEMFVPPHEAGGVAVHELAAEERPVEVGVGVGGGGGRG